MCGIASRSLITALLITTPASGHGDEPEPLSAQVLRLEEELFSGLPPVKRHAFNEARSAWQAYKKAECHQRHLNYPAVTAFEECDRDLNLDRLQDLRRQLRWLHGLPGHIR